MTGRDEFLRQTTVDSPVTLVQSGTLSSVQISVNF